MTDNLQDILPIIIEAVQDKKGRGITVLDMASIECAPTQKFVICQGTNPTQTGAIADSIYDKVLEKAMRKPYSTDGYRNCEWVILDYGEVIVHVFHPESRIHYDLEALWSDARRTDIPDLD